MKNYQFFLKGISLFILFGCTTFKSSQKTLEEDPNKVVNESSIRSLFCSGNKQIKDFKFYFVEKNLRIKSGVPISTASTLKEQIEKGRHCDYKNTLYDLAKADSLYSRFVEVDQDLFNQIQNDGIGSLNPDHLRSNCRLQNLFIRAPDGKISLHRVGWCSDPNGGSFYSGSGLSFNSFNSYSVRIPHLTTFVDKYTIIEPAEFQNNTYKDNSCIQDGKKVYGYGAEDSFNSELALGYKNQIWKRYISHFTSIKEGHSGESINVELTLDLNSFCRYGRSIQDLVTK